MNKYRPPWEISIDHPGYLIRYWIESKYPDGSVKRYIHERKPIDPKSKESPKHWVLDLARL